MNYFYIAKYGNSFEIFTIFDISKFKIFNGYMIEFGVGRAQSKIAVDPLRVIANYSS